VSDHYRGAPNCCCAICRPHLVGRTPQPWPPIDTTESAGSIAGTTEAQRAAAAGDNIVPFPGLGQDLTDEQRRANVAARKIAAGDRPQPLVQPYDGAGPRADYREATPGFGSARFDFPRGSAW
jgi:hypothetical protein